MYSHQSNHDPHPTSKARSRLWSVLTECIVTVIMIMLAMQVLLACGADPSVSTDGQECLNSLQAAAKYYSDHPELTEVPVLAAMLESRTGDDRTALAKTVCGYTDESTVLCFAAGSAAATAYLLSNVLSARCKRALLINADAFGRNSLHHACMAHNVETLKLLLSAGAEEIG